MKEIKIETERLIVREVLPEDVDGFFELDSNPNVHTYLGNRPIQTKEEARKGIEFIRQQYIDNGIGRWTMVEKATNSFVGWTGLKLMKETVNNHINYYDLGYRLVEQHWGKGYATESAIASVNYGFEVLNLDKIYAVAAIGNTSSIKVLEKAGLIKGEVIEFWGHDHYWFEISRKK